MNNSYVLPYNALESLEWTVDALLLSNDINSNKRVPLDNLVLFNRLKIDLQSIIDEQKYLYLEVNHISPESGLIQDSKLVEGKDLPARARLQVKTDDIIISSVRPERGIVAIVPPELDGCIVTNAFIVLTPTNISPELLYFILRSNQVKQELQSIATGTAVPTIKLKQLKEYQLPLESIPYDKTEEAQRLYSKWKAAHDKKRPFSEVVDTIFDEYLKLNTDSDELNRYGSFSLKYDLLEDRLDVGYYSSFQTKNNTVHSELGLLEKTNKVVKLGDVLLQFNVGASIKPTDYKEKGTPYLRIQDLESEGITIEEQNLVFLDSETDERYHKNKVKAGDILIAKVGSVGKSAMVPDEFSGAIANQHLAILTTNETVLSKYLAYLLKTTFYKNIFNSYSGGSAQKFIQLNAIKEIAIPLPTVEQQSEIAMRIESELENQKVDNLERQVKDFTDSILSC
ncbi:restriction endonuclease subunit S [Neobacillus mesonae]|uniref:restriction endonuclease subunit S n=1 Tax=Neobacillus mesonae TaxID=1193713 RepID=UPI0025735871|nr:restriction endonuclease subunit S [Neobacillus mesonae]